jgi:hypothetical protein
LKPVAITVTRTSSLKLSSIMEPKMMLEFLSAAAPPAAIATRAGSPG